MANCQALFDAIDAYIAKADDVLAGALSSAGFINTGELMDDITTLEALIARALTGETRFIKRRLSEAVDLAAFADDWPAIKALDNVDDVLAQLFYDNFMTTVPKIATSYIKEIDSALTVTKISQRTTDWAKGWSEELGRLMKLTTHNNIERLLIDNLRDGNSVADFTRALQDGGIRDEYKRARAASLTEMLRAHSVAQQEAMTQNPAVEDKKWVHTGEYRNKPRQNHVDMDGQIARKDQPFTLIGADGNVYFPMYPRDSSLPAGEAVNCHCIHQAIANEDVLGLPLEERLRLQELAITQDDGLWERELSAKNRAQAGIE